jgi:SpoVK/Ycf46/Vps4 family AAA+-type ATPase
VGTGLVISEMSERDPGRFRDLFDVIQTLPDAHVRDRYDELIGLDKIKERLTREAWVMLDPGLLDRWSTQHYGRRVALADAFNGRSPLFVFAGDVGTGKTALADSFGDAIARSANVEAAVMRLSLNARGEGAPGQMTKFINDAFNYAEWHIPTRREREMVRFGVLVIDEADALAQSREMTQMHHEDRAGVTALLQRIDRISSAGRPIITVLCTNRLSALDPALLRRVSGAVVEFIRPNEEQRRQVLKRAFSEVGITDKQLDYLVLLTGPREGREYGFTYSDLTRRLIPAVVLGCIPDHKVTFDLLTSEASQPPTPPFRSESRPAAA